jgi:hypothetical protein
MPIQTSDAVSWLAASQARQSAGDSKKIGSKTRGYRDQRSTRQPDRGLRAAAARGLSGLDASIRTATHAPASKRVSPEPTQTNRGP